MLEPAYCCMHLWVPRGAGPQNEAEMLAEEAHVRLQLVVP